RRQKRTQRADSKTPDRIRSFTVPIFAWTHRKRRGAAHCCNPDSASLCPQLRTAGAAVGRDEHVAGFERIQRDRHSIGLLWSAAAKGTAERRTESRNENRGFGGSHESVCTYRIAD